VVEIRELLLELAHKQGMTIFMSIHILTEVDRLATRLGIIHKGQLIEELDADKLEQLRSKSLVIKTRDLQAAYNALKKAGYSPSANRTDDIRLNDMRALEAADEVARVLVAANTPPVHLAVEQEDLEEHFLRLTNKTPSLN